MINVNFQVDKNEKIAIEAILYDISGKVVKTNKIFHQNESLNYVDVTNGVYILRLTGRNFSESVKIIKH